MFAIIAARNGASASCVELIREQWSTYGKLMVVLTGDDIENMLCAKDAGGSLEEFLVTVIRDFRLSCSVPTPAFREQVRDHPLRCGPCERTTCAPREPPR